MEDKWERGYLGGNKKRKRTIGTCTNKDYFATFRENIIVDDKDEKIQRPPRRSTIHLGLGNFSSFPCLRTSSVVEDAVIESIRSAKFNSYSLSVGIFPARTYICWAIAEYLCRNLPYKLLPDDVYITVGCKDAIDTILTILPYPGANILFPRTCYPCYIGQVDFCNVEVCYFDLLPEKGWEVDLDALKVLADENTVALVIINPRNPCLNVYSYRHLKKYGFPSVAEIAKELMIHVIAYEVYNCIVYGSNPFVPVGVFGSTVPVTTIGSILKSWMIPGMKTRLATSYCTRFFKSVGVEILAAQIAESIKSHLSISSRPATFIQV
nr:probable aminotransferase TAT2 [Ziziphus jujuba var. spinosa]